MAEIWGQPGAIRRAAGGLREQLTALQKIPAIERGRTLVFSGMGGSYAVCYAAATALGGQGIPTMMVDAAELLYFRRSSLNERTLLVVVSQSGESAEVVRLLREMADDGARPFVVSVTNGIDNTLASLADVPLDTRAGKEECASTMTFAGALVVMSAVVARLAGRSVEEAVDVVGAEAEVAAGAVERSLAGAKDRADRLRDWLGDRAILALLARGAGRATSEMGALTLKETAGFPAEAIQAAQFRHGPLEMAGRDAAVILVATEAATVDVDARLARELVGGGTAVLWIGCDAAELADATTISIGTVDRQLAATAAIIPIQLLAWRLALDRGYRPGTYRVASKVTTHE